MVVIRTLVFLALYGVMVSLVIAAIVWMGNAHRWLLLSTCALFVVPFVDHCRGKLRMSFFGGLR